MGGSKQVGVGRLWVRRMERNTPARWDGTTFKTKLYMAVGRTHRSRVQGACCGGPGFPWAHRTPRSPKPPQQTHSCLLTDLVSGNWYGIWLTGMVSGTRIPLCTGLCLWAETTATATAEAATGVFLKLLLPEATGAYDICGDPSRQKTGIQAGRQAGSIASITPGSWSWSGPRPGLGCIGFRVRRVSPFRSHVM